jgi:hypothetical protein
MSLIDQYLSPLLEITRRSSPPRRIYATTNERKEESTVSSSLFILNLESEQAYPYAANPTEIFSAGNFASIQAWTVVGIS